MGPYANHMIAIGDELERLALPKPLQNMFCKAYSRVDPFISNAPTLQKPFFVQGKCRQILPSSEGNQNKDTGQHRGLEPSPPEPLLAGIGGVLSFPQGTAHDLNSKP